MSGVIEQARALRRSGRLAEAISCLDDWLACHGDDAKAQAERALTHHRHSYGHAAGADIRRALLLQPEEAQFHKFQAALYDGAGDVGACIRTLRKLNSINPADLRARIDLGEYLRRDGQTDRAIAVLLDVTTKAPESEAGWIYLGNAQLSTGRIKEAEVAFGEAFRINPRHPAITDIFSTLARRHLLGKSFDQAADAAARALLVAPNNFQGWLDLAVCDDARGITQGMVARMARVAVLAPEDPHYDYWRHLALPAVLGSRNDIAYWRSRYRSGLEALRNRPGLIRDPSRLLYSGYFFLAYHGLDDKPLIEALGKLLRAKVPALGHISPHLQGWRPPAGGERRIRIAILSNFLHGHTIGQLYRGLIRHLNKEIFEVTLIRPHGAAVDEKSAELDALTSNVVNLPVDLSEQQRRISDLALDILFLPDIGMVPSTYLLAFSRFAPVQVVAWGHPDTTGLETIDYFISSTGIEPPNGEAHYTERLVKLNRLPCLFEPSAEVVDQSTRASLGLPEWKTLYGCPQSLFKFHPDFDPVLADIVKADPDGQIILLEGGQPHLVTLLKARWARDHPILLKRTTFLPKLPHANFMALLAHIDVLLDPLHFGSGHTLYEAMQHGTPIVTWPGGFMRARIVMAAYAQMGISEPPVADRVEDYAEIAVALGRDRARREALRLELKAAARERLFHDAGFVREFEAFCLKTLREGPGSNG